MVAGRKTEEGFLVTSFACAPETADLEFSFTLSHCMQKGNNLAFHLIQSFKPDETDPETAHKIGVELANGFLKDQYEYVLSTHVDKDHIHTIWSSVQQIFWITVSSSPTEEAIIRFGN